MQWLIMVPIEIEADTKEEALAILADKTQGIDAIIDFDGCNIYPIEGE